MKKLLLVSAVLLGAISASQAGVRLNIGIPLPFLPLPPLPGIVIGRPAPRAYYEAPPAYYAAPPVYEAPAPYCYDAPVVIAPPSVYFGFGSRSSAYYDRDRRYYSYRGEDHRGWDRRRSDYRGGHNDGHYRR